MSSIDRRVVEAKFDNKQFHSGVKNTLDDISQLKKGLRFDGATKGLGEIDKAAKRFSLASIGQGVDHIAGKFNYLSVVASAAITKIVFNAVDAGQRIAKSFTVQPLIDGLREYETNLNSIQTILSNTQWENKDLGDVQGALQELNEYADLTIYNFAEMARNIGTFTAAGVKLDTSVEAIKGIANLAAISGSNAQQAATAMYQLSQALSTGTVKLMDWNSVVNAGMGGKVFQDAVKDTARAHGIAIDDIIEKNGSFRDSLQEGWFTAEILTETLSKFTGDLTEAQLKQMGYTDEQTKEILKMGETAVDAATKVKTFTQLMDTVKEAVGTGWADTWTIVFGDFEEAKELWTGVNDLLGGFIGKSADARNKVLADWKALGGRTAIIEGIGEVFKSLWSVLKPIKEAFRDFFPGFTGKQLAEYSKQFRDFFENFKLGEENARNLKRTFDGVFSVIGIGWEILKGAAGFLQETFQYLFQGADNLLQTTGDLGEVLTDFYQRVKDGTAIADFFEGLSSKVQTTIDVLRDFAGWLKKALGIGEVDTESASNFLDKMIEAGKSMSSFWSSVASVVGVVLNAIGRAAASIGDFILGIPTRVAEYFSKVDWEVVLSGINTGLFAGFLILAKKFVDNMGKKGLFEGLKDLAEGLGDSFGSVTDSLDRVTGVLGTMQNTLRAATLLQIAAALGIMSWSLIALARVDGDKLGVALSAMFALFVELGAALVALNAIGGVKGLARTSTSLVILAGAIRILVSSVVKLSELSWEDISKGLTGVGSLLALVVATTALMSTNTSGMVRGAAGLVIMSAAIKVLATVVTDLGGISWEEMGRGLAGVGALLAGMVIFTHLVAVNKTGIGQGAGLLLIAAAIKVLASAAEDFAGMSWQEISKGLASIGAILAAFALFSQVVNPAGIVRTGASLLIVSGAMVALAFATQQFAEMEWGEIARGLAAMAGALALVGTAISLIPASSLASATALVVASAGLIVIAKALQVMGSMEWGEIGKALTILGSTLALLAVGLTAMSGTLAGSASLVVAAGALAILTPVLYLLGGLSWGEIAKGLVALAATLTILGIAGTLLAPAVPTFIGLAAAFLLLGGGVALLGVGLNLIASAFKTLAEVGLDAATVILELLNAVGMAIPIFGEQFAKAIIVFVTTLADSFDGLLDAIVVILTGLLEAANQMLPLVVELILEFAAQMLAALVELIPDMALAAMDIMLAILTSMEEKAPAIVSKMIDLAIALLEELTSRVPEYAEAATDLIVAMLTAIADNLDDVITAGADIVIALIEGIQENSNRIIDAGFEAIVDFINGVSDSIDEHAPELRAAGLRLALSIVDGVTGGMASKVGSVVESGKNLAKNLIGSAKGFLGIKSPSKVFEEIGQNVGQGFIDGFSGTKADIVSTWGDTMRKSIAEMSDMVNREVDTNPKITPVIDLSEIRRGAQELNNTMSDRQLMFDSSFSKAKDASFRYQVNREALAAASEKSEVVAGTKLEYNQYNNSPKALSEAEIYRQTKNQLSTVKGALENAT